MRSSAGIGSSYYGNIDDPVVMIAETEEGPVLNYGRNNRSTQAIRAQSNPRFYPRSNCPYERRRVARLRRERLIEQPFLGEAVELSPLTPDYSNVPKTPSETVVSNKGGSILDAKLVDLPPEKLETEKQNALKILNEIRGRGAIPENVLANLETLIQTSQNGRELVTATLRLVVESTYITNRINREQYGVLLKSIDEIITQGDVIDFMLRAQTEIDKNAELRKTLSAQQAQAQTAQRIAELYGKKETDTTIKTVLIAGGVVAVAGLAIYALSK